MRGDHSLKRKRSALLVPLHLGLVGIVGCVPTEYEFIRVDVVGVTVEQASGGEVLVETCDVATDDVDWPTVEFSAAVGDVFTETVVLRERYEKIEPARVSRFKSEHGFDDVEFWCAENRSARVERLVGEADKCEVPDTEDVVTLLETALLSENSYRRTYEVVGFGDVLLKSDYRCVAIANGQDPTNVEGFSDPKKRMTILQK